MLGTAKATVNAATEDLGYMEKASNADLDDKTANVGSANYTKYGKIMGLNPAQWCCQSGCCWIEKGGTKSPHTAGCYNAITWYWGNTEFHLRFNYTPRIGDQIFFSSATMPKGGAHTGIVTGTDGVRVYTIEGNTSNGEKVIPNGGEVCAKSYLLTNPAIYGYGTPNYIEESEDDDMPIDFANLTDEQTDALLARISKRLNAEPASEYAVESCQKGVESGLFADGDKDGLVDNPQGFMRRQEAAVLLNRKGLLG